MGRFHDSDIDGHMLQKTIVTAVNSDEHDNKVNEFNATHKVWFNQSNAVHSANGTVFVTTCLYTLPPEKKPYKVQKLEL